MAVKKKRKIGPIEIVLAIIAVTLLLILGAVLIWRFVIAPSRSQPEEIIDTPVIDRADGLEEIAINPMATKDELLAEVNRRRTEAGVVPLQYSPELEYSAQEKCDDMVARNYYDHVDPDGLRGVKIAERILGSYGHYNENLVGRPYQDSDAQSVFNAWFGSAPHKEAALNSEYTLTGFGICQTDDSNDIPVSAYFVEHFYGPF